MMMTRANVEAYANKHGLSPVQIDGIPEGFSWIEPDIKIGSVTHKGRIIKFSPLKDWADTNAITYEQQAD